MTTEIKYQLFRVTGPDSGYQVGDLFNSEMIAKNHALNIRDREAQEYKVISIVTTRSTLDVFTVPAYVPSLDEIAEDIITSSNGSFYMEWGDDINNLSDEDRRKVEDMVHEAISTCDCCGWHFHTDDMDDVNGEYLCWKCAEDVENNDEDEEEYE